ncbi:hypothetical protein Aros01_08645 [Streptosporangium roseum]
MAISALCAAGYLGARFSTSGGTGTDLVLALGAALAPLSVLLGAVLAIDQPPRRPRHHLAFAFAWGGGIALVASAVVTRSAEAWLALDGAVVAPVAEETAKGAVLGWLLWRRRGAIATLADAVGHAAMAGLGFATVDNAGHYLAAFAQGGPADVLHRFVHHGLGMGIAQPLWSAPRGPVVVGGQGTFDGLAGVVVAPDRGGQRQDALQDASDHATGGASAVAQRGRGRFAGGVMGAWASRTASPACSAISSRDGLRLVCPTRTRLSS